ncbi:techylectin-5A-like isoform X2 [Homarus americanus]|uniref:techylectin-5A-like isoform X2 n=1 Tax=Homarus americanus TaxID=6706 RepID=UPI001C45872C|nr:techylectin-5A-like isoform X2 [Homarus americanus]
MAGRAETRALMLLLLHLMLTHAHTATTVSINDHTRISIGSGEVSPIVLLITPGTPAVSVSVDGSSLGQQQCGVRARNCLEVQELQGHRVSGVYSIWPYECCRDRVVQVYCDMETVGGGWTVVQRRDKYETQEDFYQPWTRYVEGFGNLTQEFWLGLDNLHALTSQSNITYEARIDLGDFEGGKRWAQYTSITVEDANSSYKLVLGEYSGDAGNSMDHHTGRKFSTYDRDSDDHATNCASTYKGAWWYGGCHNSNLNGQYMEGATGQAAQGIIWQAWLGDGYSLKKTEIKIRPDKLPSYCRQ